MIITTHIVGGIEDQASAFLYGWWAKNYHMLGFSSKNFVGIYGAPFGFYFNKPLSTNQPLLTLFFNGLIQFFNPILFTNIFLIFSFLLSIVVSYFLFRLLNLNKFLSIVLSLIFSLSPFALLHIGIHPALFQIWVIPLFLSAFIKLNFSSNIRWQLLSGLFLAIAVLISNYLGFFLILFTLCFLVSNLFLQGFSFNIIKKYALMFVSFLIIAIPPLFPYIKANYFRSYQANSKLSVKRTLEDFQNFSSRPWYFVLPPKAHPILGNLITKPILDFLENDWGYFLADDYFPKEHGGNYLGIVNLIIFTIAVVFSIKKAFIKHKRTKVSFDAYSTILVFSLTAFLLFLFTLPPFFTISGITIYTPGWILYKLFPMFRVTARLSIVILMCVLIVNGIFLREIKGFNKFNLSLVGYLLVALFEFYVPISVKDVSRTPAVYEYLSKKNEKTSFSFEGPSGKKGYYEGPLIIAEYPYQRAEDIFWVTRHHKGLINPRGYKSVKFNFNSKEFTKYLATKEGLEKAREFGVSYIVFHKDRVPNEEEKRVGELKSSNPEKFFRENLVVEKEFPKEILFKL